MRKHCRVLVTGAGSGVGQGIVKALRISGLPLTIVSGDIAVMNAALYRTDEAMLLPKVESPGALETILELLPKHRIDVVMIGSEFDLSFFSEHRELILSRTGAMVFAAPINTVEIADDKWLTSEFLRENGLPHAESFLPEGIEEAITIAKSWGYPVVLKTRRGTSSRHVHIVSDEKMLAECWHGTPLPMLQKVVDIPTSELDNEYTCSVFKTSDGTLLGPFTAKRTLRGGTSWHVEVDRFEYLDPLLLAIGKVLDFTGSLNIQLMVGPVGPIPFEFNARFSGTTAVRAQFGFNEPAMALKAFFYGEDLASPQIRKGIAMRYHEEVFIDDVSAADLTPGNHKGYVVPWF